MKRIYLVIGGVLLALIVLAVIVSLYTNRKGSLLMSIAPSKSQVRIDDGEFTSVDTAFFTELTKGKHKVDVRKEGYFDNSQTVDINSGQKKIIDVTLKENPKQATATALNTPITKSTTGAGSSSSSTTSQANQTGIAQTNQNITVNQHGTTEPAAPKIANLNSLNFSSTVYKQLVAGNNAVKDAYYFSNGTWAMVVLINPAIQPSQSTKAIFQLSNNSWNQVVPPNEVFDNSIKDLIPEDLYNFLYQNHLLISRR